MFYGVCENCGGQTKAKYKSLLKRFCSHKCANQYNHKYVTKYNLAERVTVKCDNCGSDIVLLKNSHRYKSTKGLFFCNNKCTSEYYQSHPHLVYCEVCGKPFKKNRYQKTCSEECRKILLGMKRRKVSTIEEYFEVKNKPKEKKKIERKKDNRQNVFAGREKEYMKEYYAKNRERLYEKHKKRLAEDDMYRFTAMVRKKVQTAFTRRRVLKQKQTIEILGCSIEQFRKHIASQFKEGMSFANYGKWQLDHIIPLSTAKTVEEVEKLCHYTNYQPLWAEENRQKSNKLDWNGKCK